MEQKLDPRKHKRVLEEDASLEVGICELSLAWAHISSKDQRLVQVGGLPFQVHRVDPTQYGQEVVRKSSPENIIQLK